MNLRRCGVVLVAFGALSAACGSPADSSGGSGNPPLVVIGDTIAGRLRFGEADTFRLQTSATGVMAVFLQAQDSNVVELLVEGQAYLFSPRTRASYSLSPSLEANRTPHFAVVADSIYHVIVRAPAGTALGFETGRYRFRATVVDTLPENSAATVPLAADISGESLTNSADIDAWTLGTPIADTLGLVMRVKLDPPGSSVPVVASLREFLSFYDDFAMTLPGDTVTVQGPIVTSRVLTQFFLRVRTPDPSLIATVNPTVPTYHVRIVIADLRPESRPAIIGLADSLTTEAIDSVGDVDTYKVPLAPNAAGYVTALQVVTGAPDDTLEMLVNGTGGAGGGSLIQSTIADTALLSNVTAEAGPFDPGITVKVTARHLSNPLARPTYRFAVLPINRAPETASAALALGDTIASEQIDFAGDVDDFTFTGTANQVVTANMALPANFGGPVVLDVIGVGSALISPGDTLGTAPLTVTLPSTGTFTLRARDLAAQAGRGFYLLTLH